MTAPLREQKGRPHYETPAEVLMEKLPAAATPETPDAVQAALSGWGRTFRLCVIRLAERIPSIVPVTTWLILQHR